jgi:hypothetical protein
MLFIAADGDKPHRLDAGKENRPAHLADLSWLGGAPLAPHHPTPEALMIIIEGEGEDDILDFLA